MTERYILCPCTGLFGVLLVGCAANAPSTTVGVVGDWRLTAMTGLPEPARRHAPIVAYQADGALRGYDGCNGFGGAYRLEGARIVSVDVIVTTAACERPEDPDLYARGKAFLAAATDATFEVRGDVLTLRTTTGRRLTLRREKTR